MPLYLVFSALVGLTSGASFMNIAPAADLFRQMFGIGFDHLSVFLSALFWTHALSQVPAGLASDRLGPLSLLRLSAIVGCLANLLPLLAPGNFWYGVFCRLCLGLCTGMQFMAIMKFIGLLVPASRMPTVQGIYGASFGVGTMFPFLVVPLLTYLGVAGWLSAYLLGSVFFLLVLLVSYRLPGVEVPPPVAGPKLATSLRVVASTPAVWILGVLHGFSYGSLNNLGQWLPSVFADFSLGDWTFATTAVMLLGVLARAVSGRLVGWMTRAEVINRATLLIALLFVCLGLAGSPLPTLVVGLVLAFMCGINYGSIFTLGSLLVAPLYMATGLGLMNMVANLTNVFLILLLGGVREAAGAFQPAFLAVGAVVVLLWFLTRKYVTKIDTQVKNRGPYEQ
ncbi:MAG: MFS transporter [Planctomycetota bacterium]|jgi:MFS family permease|nr:MFS transporter [Planctomycetota bacterium]